MLDSGSGDPGSNPGRAIKKMWFSSLQNSEKVLATFFALLIVLLLFVYTLKIVVHPEEFQLKNEKVSELVDSSSPASYYCIQEGGTIEVIDEVRYCVLENGRECEEWDYFRGMCY